MAHGKLTALPFSLVPVSLGAAAAGGAFRDVPPVMPPVAFSQFPAATHTTQLLRHARGLGRRTTTCKVPRARAFAQSTHGGSVFGLSPLRRRRRPRALNDLRCELTRLSGDAGHKVLPALATRDQWAHYWGGSDMQRVGKFFEVSAIAFLGLWACYFTSFFLGVGTTSIIGAAFLFYWLLAPNVTAFRRNLALRGRIANVPGGDGNSVAIFSARVASATEEYHPVTGKPVFLRMVIADGEGRALKFRTRTRPEYARIREGMVAEAVLVSPDEAFEEIVGVSDTFIPDANIWVGEYPYIDKVVMLRLLANRDSKRRQKGVDSNIGSETGDEDEYSELDTSSYYDALRSKQEEEERRKLGLGSTRRPDIGSSSRASSTSGSNVSDFYSDDDYGLDSEHYHGEEGADKPQYKGWDSAGFTSESRNPQRGRSRSPTGGG